MTRSDVQDRVTRALINVAPEISASSLKPDIALRDQVDLDSMDFLRFILELHTQLGIDVPEADYQQLATLNTAVDYVSARLGAPPM